MTDNHQVQFTETLNGLNLQMLRDLAGQVATQKGQKFEDVKEVPIQLAQKLPPIKQPVGPVNQPVKQVPVQKKVLKSALKVPDVVLSSESPEIKSLPDNMMAIMGMNLPKQTIYLLLVLLIAAVAIWYLGSPAKTKKKTEDEDE